MKQARVVAALFVSVLLQTAVIPALLPGVIVPDFVFCLSAAVAIAAGGGQGVALAAVGGLIKYGLTGAFVGANAGADMAAAALIGIVEPQLFKESLLTPAVVIGVATWVREAVYMFAIGSFGARVDVQRAVYVLVPWLTALNCCAGVLIYRWIYLHPRERQSTLIQAEPVAGTQSRPRGPGRS